MEWFRAILKSRPMLTNCVTSGMLFSIGDALSQSIEYIGTYNKSNWRYDSYRTFSKLLFGICFMGPPLYAWVRNILPALIPATGPSSSAKRMLLD